MADERGAFDGGQPGEWTPSAGPAPGAGWAPIGGTQARAYSPYQQESLSPYKQVWCKRPVRRPDGSNGELGGRAP